MAGIGWGIEYLVHNNFAEGNTDNILEAFAKKNDIQTYLITVDLPDKLTTNYGTTLDFNYEIKGMADILTKKRKLLLRLFDNLKYIASKKTI